MERLGGGQLRQVPRVLYLVLHPMCQGRRLLSSSGPVLAQHGTAWQTRPDWAQHWCDTRAGERALSLTNFLPSFPPLLLSPPLQPPPLQPSGASCRPPTLYTFIRMSPTKTPPPQTHTHTAAHPQNPLCLSHPTRPRGAATYLVHVHADEPAAARPHLPRLVQHAQHERHGRLWGGMLERVGMKHAVSLF